MSRTPFLLVLGGCVGGTTSKPSESAETGTAATTETGGAVDSASCAPGGYYDPGCVLMCGPDEYCAVCQRLPGGSGTTSYADQTCLPCGAAC